MVLSLRKIKLSKLSVVSVVSNMFYGKKRTQKRRKSTKAILIGKDSLLTVTIIRNLLENYQFGIYVPFWF